MVKSMSWTICRSDGQLYSTDIPIEDLIRYTVRCLRCLVTCEFNYSLAISSFKIISHELDPDTLNLITNVLNEYIKKPVAVSMAYIRFFLALSLPLWT